MGMIRLSSCASTKRPSPPPKQHVAHDTIDASDVPPSGEILRHHLTRQPPGKGSISLDGLPPPQTSVSVGWYSDASCKTCEFLRQIKAETKLQRADGLPPQYVPRRYVVATSGADGCSARAHRATAHGVNDPVLCNQARVPLFLPGASVARTWEFLRCLR